MLTFESEVVNEVADFWLIEMSWMWRSWLLSRSRVTRRDTCPPLAVLHLCPMRLSCLGKVACAVFALRASQGQRKWAKRWEKKKKTHNKWRLPPLRARLPTAAPPTLPALVLPCRQDVILGVFTGGWCAWRGNVTFSGGATAWRQRDRASGAGICATAPLRGGQRRRIFGGSDVLQRRDVISSRISWSHHVSAGVWTTHPPTPTPLLRHATRTGAPHSGRITTNNGINGKRHHAKFEQVC